MPLELLTTNIRLGSADIFSLGMSIFELCCATSVAAMTDYRIFERPNPYSRGHSTSQLPQSGPGWHLLRHDGLIDVTSTYVGNPILRNIINCCLKDQFALRPTATDLLQLPEIGMAGQIVDHGFIDLLTARREQETHALQGRDTPTGQSSFGRASFGSNSMFFVSRSDSATDLNCMQQDADEVEEVGEVEEAT